MEPNTKAVEIQPLGTSAPEGGARKGNPVTRRTALATITVGAAAATAGGATAALAFAPGHSDAELL